jgi:hypothetical protein
MKRLLFFVICGCDLQAGGAVGGVQADASMPDTRTGIEAGSVPFVPSHTTVMFDSAVPDLIDPTAIDTDSLSIAFGGATKPPPAGIIFAVDGSRAVLRVGALTASLDIKVVGARPLIIVASGTATVGGKIDAAGRLGSPGPGGSASSSGPGAGVDGSTAGGCNAGGGGASFGAIGGTGGMTRCGAGTVAGPLYGSINDFFGGSGGGQGAGACGGSGGSGGGAIQISSLLSVRIVGGGGIHVGGGGGAGGCGGNDDGGGGGGSGGTIFLEAPVVEVSGALGANGGGGGEGGHTDFIVPRAGEPGADAVLDITPAAGGTSMGSDRSGGAGGARTMPAESAPTGNGTTGGGGGAIGRIFLRTRGTPANMPSGKISPVPALDTSL